MSRQSRFSIEFFQNQKGARHIERKAILAFLFPPFAMKIFMDIAELFVRHVGVDLGGGDVGVAEESLDGAEVGAVA